jgi:predicted acetyltransferase
MVFLTEPTLQYKNSFIEGVREFQREGKYRNFSIQQLSNNFEEFLHSKITSNNPTRLSPYLVPATDFWLIDDNEYIGRLSLRHELNALLCRIGGHIGYEIRPSKRRQGYGKLILGLGLAKAREIGLKRALVTCDENNIGSKKVIEYNGGKFENAVEVEGSPVKKLRYWIDLT